MEATGYVVGTRYFQLEKSDCITGPRFLLWTFRVLCFFYRRASQHITFTFLLADFILFLQISVRYLILFLRTALLALTLGCSTVTD
jgi:hypothetical protein